MKTKMTKSKLIISGVLIGLCLIMIFAKVVIYKEPLSQLSYAGLILMLFGVVMYIKNIVKYMKDNK